MAPLEENEVISGLAFPHISRDYQPKPNVVILRSVREDIWMSKLRTRWRRALEAQNVSYKQIDPLKVKPHQLERALDKADGVFLPGGDINVNPKHFGQEPIDQRLIWGEELPDYLFCDERFEAAKTMVEYAVANEVPIMGICLGAQEMNVALGGRLQQRVQGHEGQGDSDEHWDSVAHDIRVLPGGKLSALFEPHGLYPQNSAHRQGMLRADLSDRVQLEAVAADCGEIVEAYSVKDHPFGLGLQFHAESLRKPETVAMNQAIFDAYGDAIFDHAGMERVEPVRSSVLELNGMR